MTNPTFEELGLPQKMADALASFGYESPSPIQAEAIPYLLEKRDIIGQAQTGTGKTAAFALPLLANLDLSVKNPQVLVLAPTRELAIQVAESFQKYARPLKGFHVLPIYGGQGYHHQLQPLRRGVHVVVGTPGRVCDHIRKGSLKLDSLKCLVLDEADEMLRMGFIEDVNWVLEQTPDERQIALFSATMPREIKKIATTYLQDPAEVKIKVRQATADTIRQRYQIVSGRRKIDALTRLLEVEDGDAMLIFVRTKNATAQVAEQLEARGFSAACLNGDIVQSQREQIVQRLRDGKLDIIVATDVAARGLDVPRITHVVNFDAPTDPESYVHRIGRTGRAGSKGDAILFVTPREKRLLNMLGKVTKAEIHPMKMATMDEVNNQRVERFKDRITKAIVEGDLDFNVRLVDSYLTEHPGTDAAQLAAALAFLAQGEKSLLISESRPAYEEDFKSSGKKPDRKLQPRDGRRKDPRKVAAATEKGMERFKVQVGHQDQLKPGVLVAAIANASGLTGKHIGRIEIYQGFTTVDLPEGMPRDVFEDLYNTKVCNRSLQISRVKDS